MPHDTPLISTIVAGLVLAFIFGAIAHRFRMPPLVGYLVAGVLVGPFTPGFVADTELANELSEIGVILLMFGVGLHFSLKDLLSVQAVAVPGALLRMAAGTAMGMGLGLLMGWSWGGGLVFGLALSVASTVVLLKALQDRHLVDSDRGRIAVGWVIVEDIAMVLALVLIPAFAGVMGGNATELHDPFIDLFQRLSGVHLNIWGVLAVTVVKLAAFVGFMLVVGRRVIPWILHLTAHTGSRELFRLAVLAIALGVAAGAAYLFGVSLALGAFFAGMILSESELSNRAAQESLPFRDAFSVLFFVAVGMLFNPMIIITNPLPVLGTLFIIIVGKSVVGFFLVIALKRSVGAALTISASLAQIGEFSFILAALGIGLGLFPQEAQSYILAGAIISIIVNPLLMYAAEHLRPQLEARLAADAPIVVPQRVEPDLATTPALAPEPVDDRTPSLLVNHTVLIGYGRVGTVVADGLKRQDTPFVLIEDSEKRVAAAHAAGVEVVIGNAAAGKALQLANVAGARTLMIAIPNAFEAGQAVEQARKINPNLQIIARAHSDEEVTYLQDLGANQVIMGEREIGLGMLGWTNGENQHEAVVERTQASMEAIAAALKLEPVLARPTPITPLPPAERIIPGPVPVAVDAPVAETLKAAPPEAPMAEVAPANIDPMAEPEMSVESVMTASANVAVSADPDLAYEPVVTPAPLVEPQVPEVAAEILEAEIEAAHPEHPVGGPAEPFSEVPALGEMPVEGSELVEPTERQMTAEPPEPVIPTDIGAPPAKVDDGHMVETVDLSMFVLPAPVPDGEPETQPEASEPPAAAQLEPVIIVPEVPEPSRARPSAPATTPGSAFKPDPVPADD